MQRFLSILLCAGLLAGCATTTAPTAASVGAYRDTIQLTGRLSVQYEKNGQPESLSGKFDWAQQGDRVDVNLVSPLGQTVAKISVTPAEATLTEAGKAPRSAPDIDTLTAQTLGWPLPVSGLRDWLQGYAVDATGQRFAASPAHDTVTTKDGWKLRYVSWQEAAAAHPQPKRIDAERPAGLNTSGLTIRIVLDPQA
ncbi:MAG: lipoprotein insertase outer membrane protein LolB [Telluria sp.]